VPTEQMAFAEVIAQGVIRARNKTPPAIGVPGGEYYLLIDEQ
jgi:hypothetical protein